MIHARDLLNRSLLSGLAGATALTVVHESARRILPDAPRMDVLGRRSLSAAMRAVGAAPPTGDRLQAAALGGDLVSNALYYSLVGLGGPGGALARGVALGALAGVGAVVIPPRVGLGRAPSGATAATRAMTVSWYVLGGVAAALAFRPLERRAAF